ncbi:glutathione S-transferase N-terminal domain-containing protein [Laribacter hongkongensis]|uniref:glutathione S-transferase family protein n=1 Tax=Laribacter hongkongensis TaxID=168471 RepID=UPI001EFC344B|nr:glutathione S-transferase N-terminal domain-containing protein [Laribacter hongkongensis]MCG8994894.1 glutathione S-transferase N-terminal domain-containing protein [Laribacter hongkongensis]MCG9010504.1 glutathione S-transferase N-terminal domain-containing protein [Laribacter hongkongensis]MCG9046373.1 glutathione S-transferase N-terminal domain-containing protein [Laribacter hongkongensis]MCG9073210.1 glutathione S-transferase N-terminal domain-containing protein [Laribacter hongkongensis
MKLYASLTSPYARKVRVVLHEKRIECQLEPVNPWDADSPLPAVNPLGKVPVLMLDDGTALYDSRVIVDYLDSISPVSKLLADGARGTALIKRWEALADGLLDAGVAIMLERRRPAERQDAGWLRRQHDKLTAGLALMAADLTDRTWCHGNGFTLVDIAVGCTLGWLDLRLPWLDWRQYPALTGHYERLMTRPSFADTCPPAA